MPSPPRSGRVEGQGQNLSIDAAVNACYAIYVQQTVIGGWKARRRITVALGAALLASQLFVAPALAVYRQDCGVGALGSNWTFISRTKSSPSMDAVIGELTIRTLRPCTNPDPVDWDLPFALAANLQKSQAPADKNYIVQIGYAVCGRAEGACNGNIPNDGQPHFVYTNDDDNGGLVVLADGWYHAPQAGHQYRFRISPATNASGQAVWEYCIKDKGTGEAYDCTKTADLRSWSSGIYAWWGTETYNTASQNGNSFNESELDLRWLQYRRSSTWYVVSDQSGCETRSVDEFGDPKPYPSTINGNLAYHCQIVSTVDVDGDGQVNDLETLWSHTHSY